MLRFIKRIPTALFIGFVSFVVTIIVLVVGIIKFLFSREEPNITYRNKDGKVVNLNDFRADKTGGEL